MAVIFCNALHTSPLSMLTSPYLPLSPRARLPPLLKPLRAQFKSMDQRDELREKLMEFPYVSAARRRLMIDLISTVENRLGSQLLPCSLPADVRYFENQTGTAQASLEIRSGEKSSPIDFILGSWIHCDLSTGTSLNITSLSTYLNSSTDAPNFVIELIQNSPTSLILILDLPHRRDLVLYPEYLKTFYEDTHLDAHRQSLVKLPEIKPYVSPSLFVRCAFSPAAVMVMVNAEATERLEEILRDHVSPVAKGVLGLWLDECVSRERVLGDDEKGELKKRDSCFRTKTVEVDLGSSFPRMFGNEVATRVLSNMREVFRV